VGFALLMVLSPAAAHSQMMAGCRLVQGSLQCVPGLTADPQQQIEILDQQISNTEQQEGAIEQTIQGLEAIELRGAADEGALLTASLRGALSNAVAPANYHWYQGSPGAGRWVLIESASGPTFIPGAGNVGQLLMVVLTVSEPDGVKRISSSPVGPIQPAK
jgi:hypothetical protein